VNEQGLYGVDGSFRSDDQIKRETSHPLFDAATQFLKDAQRIKREYDIGVKEAVWTPEVEDPRKPLTILLATDIHYGAVGTDYDLLQKHIDIVEHTPNTTLVTNGDHVDNFNTTGKWAEGMYENALPPQRQTAAFIERLRNLDSKKKLGVMSFGNHDMFGNVAGYDWFNTFARNLTAPVFTSGGLLHILYGSQHYQLALTHRYWGNSKLNPSNVCKRFMEHEYPDADIIFLGHTHQSELLTFERGGKERIAVIGGTYKVEDDWARQHGIGGRSGQAGICVKLYPNERKMIGFKHIEDSL